MVSEPIYSLPVSEAFRALETSSDGLDSSEVEARRRFMASTSFLSRRVNPPGENL